MLEIGVNPNDFTMEGYLPPAAAIELNSLIKPVTLLSFIDIIDGWTWIDNLNSITGSFGAELRVIAVFFNRDESRTDSAPAPFEYSYTGVLTTGWLDDKLDHHFSHPGGKNDLSFDALIDVSWNASQARIYSNGAFGTAPYNSTPDNGMLSFLFWNGIAPAASFPGTGAGSAPWDNLLMTDKWHNLTTADADPTLWDPLSFYHLEVASGNDFNSAAAHFNTAEEYVIKRIENLQAALKIIKGDPVNGTVVHSPVGIKRVILSRPLEISSAQTASNYTLSGGGVQNGGPDNASSASCSGADMAENAVALSFGNSSLIDTHDNEVILELDNTGNLKDSSNTDYTDTENTISYFAEVADSGPVLGHRVSLSDGSGADMRINFLEAGAPAVCVVSADRRLNVRILSDNPGSNTPQAWLSRPTEPDVDLSFNGLVSDEIDQSRLTESGSYTLHIEEYTDGDGTPLAASVFYFGIIDPAVALNSISDALEGWGYFPREEGLPENCPESSAPQITGPDGTGIPVWEASGTASVSAGGGQPLSVSKDGALPMNMVYRRDYGSILKNDGGAGNWDAPAYIEAALNCTEDPLTDVLTVSDLSDPAAPVYGISMRTSGTGISLQNGPRIAVLSLVNVISAGAPNPGYRLALELHSNVYGQRAFAFSDTAVDWKSSNGFQLISLTKEDDGSGGQVFQAYLDGSALFLNAINETRLPTVDFISYPGTAAVGFGVFEDRGQEVTALFDFVRYAFYDSRYKPVSGVNELSVGFPRLRRAGPADAEFFRSPDILLNGLGDADPDFQQINTINVAASVAKIAAGNLASKSIPVKVRFCAADFDDLTQRSVAGFKDPAAFPSYGDPGLIPLGGGNPPTRVLSLDALDSVSDTGEIPWGLEADRGRLARRLFILVCADAPLLEAPALRTGASGGNYLDVTVNAAGERTGDLRTAVRQFLPDFYVRDTAADDGVQNPGGWLSPDIALGVFSGGTVGSSSLPDPQGTAEPLYPAGFARGADNAVYSPDGFAEIDSNVAGESIKITDTGWSDYGSQCYYNRIWVRLSNRGIVPGPANVQVFFLGSLLRAAFDPMQARGSSYEKIYADNPPTGYVQTKFQRYSAVAGGYDLDIVEAVPPLCGASDWRSPAEYLIAEYLWHVAEADVPPDVSDNHGCNAVTINLPDQPDWMSGVDTSPAINTAQSVWAANTLTNNVTVRNSNIAVGQPPATDDVANKSAIDSNDDPVNYKKLANNFKPVFSRRQTIWSLAVDTKAMPGSEIILRVPQWIAAGAKLNGFKEMGINKRLPGAKPVLRKYRYFFLRNGREGRLDGVSNFFNLPHFKRYMQDTAVSVYYRLDSGVKPGNYRIEIKQLARGKVVGGYTAAITVQGPHKIDLIGDERIKAVFDAKKYPEVLHAVPYAKRQPMTGMDIALRRHYRIGPDRLKAEKLKTVRSLVNGDGWPAAEKKDGIIAAAVGMVLNRKGGVGGALVELCTSDGRLIASARTCESGCYLITLDSNSDKHWHPSLPSGGIKLVIRAFLIIGKKKVELGRVERKIDEPFFAMPDLYCRKNGELLF